jgi:threonine dehydratase
VFVPEWAPSNVLALIESLGASIVVCERRDDDPPGDPSLLRFRDAVLAGALPFTVQGPENALCLDGGRTLGWEIADTVGTTIGPASLDRAVVQVGGGALAACVGWGLGPAVRLDTVQAQGCAPLARAWWRAKDAGYAAAQLPGRWQELMTPWERPRSIADGILDDETYDWLADFDVMAASGGQPIVVPEEAIVEAAEVARATGIDVSATGAAGVAALLVGDGRPTAGETVAVIFSGVRRG